MSQTRETCRQYRHCRLSHKWLPGVQLRTLGQRTLWTAAACGAAADVAALLAAGHDPDQVTAYSCNPYGESLLQLQAMAYSCDSDG